MAARTTKEDAILAVGRFITANTSMRSSQAIGMAMADVRRHIDSSGKLVLVPISHKLFDYKTSLLWVAFVADLARRAGNIQFNATAVLKTLAEVYDLAHSDFVTVHYVPDADSDDSDDDDFDVPGVPGNPGSYTSDDDEDSDEDIPKPPLD